MPDSVDRWLPTELVRAAQQISLERFQYTTDGRYCLVIVTAGRSELEAGLLNQQRPGGDSMPAGPSTATELPMRSWQPPPNQRAADLDALCLQKLRALRRDACYLLPLIKYTADSAPGTFSVGRAIGQDVTLRDKSISRVHASLEIEGTRYYVRDLGSHNHTFVNEQKIERAELQPGDSLRFGSIGTIVCTTRALWHAARAKN